MDSRDATDPPDHDEPAHILLLTGRPGVGKTTLVRRVVDAMPGRTVRGFVTDEIRERGRRVGFRLEAFEGEGAVLSHVSIDSHYHVGRYGVDTEALDRVVDRQLRFDARADLYVIDEIGKMECFSDHFVATVKDLLDSRAVVVATIHASAGGFIGRVRRRLDTELWEVTEGNRETLVEQVIAWVDARGR